MLGLAFSILNSWTALASSLSVGRPSGGPVAVIRGLVTAGVSSLPLAASNAEILSSYPTSAGHYNWAAIISPPKWVAVSSWVTGWINVSGWVALSASGATLGGSLFLGMITMYNPNFSPEQWQLFLLFLLYTVMGFFFNLFLGSGLPIMTKVALVWSVCGLICENDNDCLPIKTWNRSGLFVPFLFPAVIYTIQASAKPNHLAMAVAMCSFFRSLGQCLGVAVGGVVFQNRMRTILEGHPVLAPHAAEYSKDAAELMEILRIMSDVPDKEALRAAYTDGLRYVWIFCGALAGASILLSILTKDYHFEETEEVQVAVGIKSEGQTASYEAKHASQGTNI